MSTGVPGALEGTPSSQPSCPFCQSNRVATTSKSIGDETYWRCHACGEIWNPSRLPAAVPRYGWR